MHRKEPEEDDWEKRLVAAHKSFQEEALLLLRQQHQQQPPTEHVKDVADVTIKDVASARKPVVTLQRSRAYPVAPTASNEEAAAASDSSSSIKRRSKLHYQRLKPFHPAPMSEESAEQLQSYHEDRTRKTLDADHMDHSDGSVQSSYHPLDVDLDDDAIMV